MVYDSSLPYLKVIGFVRQWEYMSWKFYDYHKRVCPFSSGLTRGVALYGVFILSCSPGSNAKKNIPLCIVYNASLSRTVDADSFVI